MHLLASCVLAGRDRKAAVSVRRVFSRALRAGLFLVASAACAAPTLSFSIEGGGPSGWQEALSSIGLARRAGEGPAQVIVVRAGARGEAQPWLDRAAQGAFLILEGQSAVAQSAGFQAGDKQVRVASLTDVHQPRTQILWEQPLDLPVYRTPPEARVFTQERWTGAPLAAGFRHGSGAILWVAAPPGPHGYERFPYLLHALAGLGLEAPFQSRRLWAFFDSSYRARADLDYLARRWRRSGIAALHVAAWHFYDPDPAGDEYLLRLIEACHRNGILVYAWLELPHVSDKFWNDHPDWREKTAVLQDAHLDWRKLMNLANRDCFRAAADGVRQLVERFGWDGVNLAELYFESLEGAANPSRFTPMNDDVRAEFRRLNGLDPLELFSSAGPERAAALRKFLDYRAELARRIQEEWLGEIEGLRRNLPELDIVLTHVDDRFDTGMRDAIGADAARLLPLLERHSFTFLVEDPATVWHLGPQRYPEIARRYQPLTPRPDRLAIDINVVERYQDVYPTRQQTGAELFQLVRLASESFPRVALYFENSIAPADLGLLSAAAAPVSRAERIGTRLAVESKFGVGVPWNGPVLVDGRPWPVTDGALAWIPPGAHILEPGRLEAPARLLDLNADLVAASAEAGAIQFSYRSGSRALAVLDRQPARLEIDGSPEPLRLAGSEPGRWVLELKRGQHIASIWF
jgi:hypothetical protein